jgi:hypothetical protein
MLTVETDLHSVLNIAKAVRDGCAVYASLVDRIGKERVKGVKACGHLTKREVLTVYGWNHPTRVWMESSVAPIPEASAAAA